MDKEAQASQIYARTLYPLGRGCALWVPEPNNDLPPAYLQTGVEIGDVGVLRADGSFDFVFNACCSADNPVNRDGVPDDFQPLVWNGIKRTFHNYFRPGQLVLSRGAIKRALDIEGTVSVLGTPVGVGAGFSITFAKNHGAVIFPPNGATSIDCRDRTTFREYAEKYSDSWYRFMNEKLGMEVENGAIYFITGFDKTDRWEIAVSGNSLKEQTCKIIVNTGGLVGGESHLMLSSSSQDETFLSRCSLPNNPYLNQALFIRGFRISIRRKLKSFFSGLGVEVKSMYDSSWKEALGKKGSYLPYSRGHSSGSPGSGGSPSTESSLLGESTSLHGRTSKTSDVIMMDRDSSPEPSCTGNDSDTSIDEDDHIPPSELYHPLKAINDYILQSARGQDEVEVVITHDEDFFAILTDKDFEMPDEKELLRRLTDLFRVTVKDGCGSLERLEVADYSLHRSESDPATADSLSFQDDIDMDHTSGCSLDKEMLPAPRPPYIRTALASSMSPAKRTLIPQRKHHKLLKDGSDSEAIDRVFTEGLKAYWNSPWASCSGGRSRWRNQYLVEFLQQRGIERSKKQVASHLQVLRNMWKGEPEYHLIAGADEAALDPDSSSSNSISSSSSLLSSLPTFVPSSPVSDSEDGGGPRSEGDGNISDNQHIYPPEAGHSYVYKIPLPEQNHIPVPNLPKRRPTTLQSNEKRNLGLACFFCRGRKIACGPHDPKSSDRTCGQCHRRSLKCEYPTESRRGMRKKRNSVEFPPGFAEQRQQDLGTLGS